jgi:hypothetical protein
LSQLDRRFQIAFDKARADWSQADLRRAVALSGSDLSADGDSLAAIVSYFGKAHRVPHPAGDVLNLATGKVAHASIAIVLWHYLLTADGTAPADRWLTFRELPSGLFYAQAFAVHAEQLLADTFGSDAAGFRKAAEALGGRSLASAPGAGLAQGASLAPPDAAYRFQAFPRLAMAVQLWEGDDESPGRAQVLFDAAAGNYLPTEDLSGVGDWLAHKLKFAR